MYIEREGKKMKTYEVDFRFYVQAKDEKQARVKAMLLLCKDLDYIKKITIKEIKRGKENGKEEY